jgi:putative ABC transport system substrate-binding protein
MNRRAAITLLGGAAAWPLAARAQTGRSPTIGALWPANNSEELGSLFRAFVDGLTHLGYVEGRNINIEHRFASGVPQRFRSLAAELVALNVDVLVAGGNSAASYAKDATKVIPIVFTLVADPIGMNIVSNLARPDGNITGLSNIGRDLTGKRFELLKEIVPNLSRVGLLVNPEETSAHLYASEGSAAASALGLTVAIFQARSIDQLERAFDAMAKDGVQALALGPGTLLFLGRTLIGNFAAARRLPACGWSREVLDAGSVISYGPDQRAIMRRTAAYVDRLLKGAKPAELPVEQPTKFEFLINLKTARALGLEIPPTLLARADEVIE